MSGWEDDELALGPLTDGDAVVAVADNRVSREEQVRLRDVVLVDDSATRRCFVAIAQAGRRKCRQQLAIDDAVEPVQHRVLVNRRPVHPSPCFP